MLGAIIGDMIGSQYEFGKVDINKINIFNHNSKMTDDSFLTLAVMRVLSNNYPIKYDSASQTKIQNELRKELIRTWRNHKDAGYGAMFYEWCQKAQFDSDIKYYSKGNGAAMRISPVGWICNSIDEIKILSKTISEITHDSEEALLSAEAVAVCIFLSRNGYRKAYIQKYVLEHYYPEIKQYNFIKIIEDKHYSCLAKDTVPLAIYSFLSSGTYKETLETSLLIGGDIDTICSISLAIAEAYYSRNELNKFESDYLYWMIEPDVEKELAAFYKLIGNNKLERKYRI